jgi:hypothetical protein
VRDASVDPQLRQARYSRDKGDDSH